MIKKDIVNFSKAIVLGLVLSVGVGYLSAAWTEPGVAPTGGNTDAPLNIGSGTQTKGTTANGGAGSLTLTGALTTSVFKLIDSTPTDDAGKVLISNESGIGTWQDARGAGGAKFMQTYGYNAGGAHITPNITIDIPAGVTKLIITPTLRMECRLPADGGRAIATEFKAKQGNNVASAYALIRSAAGNNNGGQTAIQASTNGVISVVPGPLTLSAESSIYNYNGAPLGFAPFVSQGTSGQSCAHLTVPYFFTSFIGYIIYGY